MKKNDLLTGGISLVDWVPESTQLGTPSMALLPSRHYSFKVTEKRYKITIPRKGTYHEIEPTYFAKEDGQFNLLDEESNVMYLPAISKVLFATKQYPELQSNQLFVPIALKFNKDTVDVYGQVLEFTDTKEV